MCVTLEAYLKRYYEPAPESLYDRCHSPKAFAKTSDSSKSLPMQYLTIRPQNLAGERLVSVEDRDHIEQVKGHPLSALLDAQEEPFHVYLMKLLDLRGIRDAELYHKANLSRQSFSRIRSGESLPKKRTILTLAVLMHLTFEQAKELLMRAGYAFSTASKADLIVAYFLKQENFDLYQINKELVEAGEMPLGDTYRNGR